MLKTKDTRAVILFALFCPLFSWPFFFCADAGLAPMFARLGDPAAATYSVVAGHMLGMLGPALAALMMWRVFHKESPPAWKWSRLKYYLWVVLAMLVFWTLPGLIGLAFGDTFVSPVADYIWISIAVMAGLGWITGMGEETGWCAYVLPRLAPAAGKTGAMIVSGAIRGMWHWPILVAPIIAQVASGERTPLELLGAGVVIAVQLVVSNVLFGAIFGWIWYRTESIPLLGWLHYWYDLARDATILLLVGYVGSLWVTFLNPFIMLPLGWMLLDQTLRGEGMGWKDFLGRLKAPQPDGAA
ncbi:MAG: CPBP family intramembrane glutamic endopeptidase [Anaerolineales bacterium]